MNDYEEFDETEFEALRKAAAALPREIAPPEQAWGDIRDRIEATRVRELAPAVHAEPNSGEGSDVATVQAPRGVHRSWIRSTRGAALIAATLFIAVTTLVVKREGALNSGDLSPYAADTGRTDMTGVFARYDGAATDLVNHLERRRATLNPTVVAVLDSCLSTIDEAIRETRDALKDAPENTTIAELLEVTYQQKLDLLRRASEFTEGSY